jgi:putative transposase
MKRRRALAEKLEGIDSWPKAAVAHLPEWRREGYRNNEKAIRALRDTDASVEEVAKAHDMSSDELYRLVRRATSVHPNDQRLWGWRGVVPYTKVEPYERTKELPTKPGERGAGGSAGAFMAFISKYQALKDFIYSNVFRAGPEGKLIRKLSIRKLHVRLLNKIRKDLKLPETEYPLNQKTAGRRSLNDYVRKLENRNLERVLHYSESPEIAALFARRTVNGQQLYATRPFEIVQADGHELKLNIRLTLKRPDGSKMRILVPRMWLIAFLDVYSRAIIGYTLVPYENYSSFDVLSATAAALYGRPETDRLFPKIAGSSYPGKSLPVEFEPKLSGISWDILSFDNALAHIAKDVSEKLLRIVNCAVCRGLPGVPEFRSFIERAFQTLQKQGGLEQLVASRMGGRKVDIKDAVDLEVLAPLIDGLIWEYNCEIATEGNYGRLPYEAILDVLSDPLTRKVAADRWGRAHFTTRRKIKAVRGNPSTGHPPYIEFAHARYSGPVLLDHPEWIGDELIFEYDEDDVLYATIYSLKGHELGRVRADGRWGRRPHSLRLRELIWAQIHARRLKVPEGVDFVTAFFDAMRSSTSPLGSRARAALGEVAMRAMSAAPTGANPAASGVPAGTASGPARPATARKAVTPIPVDVKWKTYRL